MSSFLGSSVDGYNSEGDNGLNNENVNFRTESSIESMYSENNDLMNSARNSISSVV